jgi:hypothetical protein
VAPLVAWSGCAQVQSKSQEIGARLKAQADYTWKQFQQPKVGTTAASFLKHIRQDRDPNARYVAYAKLADPNCYSSPEQKAEAVKTLVAKFETGGEPMACRAVIIHTLGQLRDPQARETVLKAVDDPEPIIRAQACRALGLVGKKEDATVLTRKMTVDTLVDCRIAAIEALGELKPDDKRIPLVLVNGMQHDEPAVRLASVEALRKITGKDLGLEPGPWIKMIQPETLAAKPSSPTPTAARSRRATDADTKQASLPPAAAPSARADAPIELPPRR